MDRRTADIADLPTLSRAIVANAVAVSLLTPAGSFEAVELARTAFRMKKTRPLEACHYLGMIIADCVSSGQGVVGAFLAMLSSHVAGSALGGSEFVRAQRATSREEEARDPAQKPLERRRGPIDHDAFRRRLRSESLRDLAAEALGGPFNRKAVYELLGYAFELAGLDPKELPDAE